MTTPKNPLIDNLPTDSLHRISDAVASLKDHLLKHSQSDEDNSNISAVLKGMYKNAEGIKEALDYEASRIEKSSYPHSKKFKAWLETVPAEFPPAIDMSKGKPAFLNPLIGEERADTEKNIRYILEMFKTLALPSYTEKADFSLGEDETWGFVHTLECMTGALAFEEKYRNHDYVEDYGLGSN